MVYKYLQKLVHGAKCLKTKQNGAVYVNVMLYHCSEVSHQESLVQKKLSKTLGHSSKCLFTLLLYYLYGQVRDIEVDLCGRIYSTGGENRFCLYMGKILTTEEDKMVWSGVRQLDRALQLFKFVWESAGMKGVLELQGHLWCVGAEGRMLTYKGNMFFVHGISV